MESESACSSRVRGFGYGGSTVRKLARMVFFVRSVDDAVRDHAWRIRQAPRSSLLEATTTLPLTALKGSPRKSQRREWPRLRPQSECLENRALLSDTVITFDDLAAGTHEVSNQYQTQGVFSRPSRSSRPPPGKPNRGPRSPASWQRRPEFVSSLCLGDIHDPTRST